MTNPQERDRISWLSGRTRYTLLTLTCVLAMAAACLTSQAAEGTATVSLSPLKKRPLKGHPGRENQTLHERQAGFSFGPTAYAIAYKAGYDPNQPVRAFPVEGTIGMPRPASCNWYHSGFLFIYVNGKDIGNAPLSSMLTAESGERAILDLVWHHAEADVRVRFAGLPQQDYLICEVTLDPKTEVKSLSLKLRCYPSFFTSWHKRVGARRIQTPNELIVEGDKKTLPSETAWWGVYYDEVFDIARGEGDGPCAFLVDPRTVNEVHHAPGGYAVETVLRCKPEARRVRMALWDFRGMHNAVALNRVREADDSVRQQLETIDLTPAHVSTFDAAAMRREIATALKSGPVRKALGTGLKEVEEWLAQVSSEGAVQAAGKSITQQEALLTSLDKFRGFVWEVRLAELVSEF